MHRTYHGDYGNESNLGVRSVTLRLDFVSHCLTHCGNKISSPQYRILIAHFSFEPAYDGQVAKPTSAVTMSMLPPEWLLC